MPGRSRPAPADGDADQLQRAADPGVQIGGLPDDQPGDLGADGAAAQQGDPQRPVGSAGWSRVGRVSTSCTRPVAYSARRPARSSLSPEHPRLRMPMPPDAAGSGFILPHRPVNISPDVEGQEVVEGLAPDRVVICRPGPRPPAAAARGCSCWPSTGCRRRRRARRAGRRARCRRAGTRRGPGCRRPRSACRPPGRAPAGAADRREARVAEYSAAYRAVRMLSLIPPSTAT